MEEVKRKRGRPKKGDSKDQYIGARVKLKTVDRLEMMSEDFEKTKSDIISEAIDVLFTKLYC